MTDFGTTFAKTPFSGRRWDRGTQHMPTGAVDLWHQKSAPHQPGPTDYEVGGARADYSTYSAHTTSRATGLNSAGTTFGVVRRAAAPTRSLRTRRASAPRAPP
jgi:hypothetical protein